MKQKLANMIFYILGTLLLALSLLLWMASLAWEKGERELLKRYIKHV